MYISPSEPNQYFSPYNLSNKRPMPLLCKWGSLLMPGWIKFSNQDWLWIHFLTIHQNFCFSLFCLLSFKADHCCQSCGSYSASWEFGCLNRNAKLRPAAMPGWKHKSPSEQVVIFWAWMVIGCSIQNKQWAQWPGPDPIKKFQRRFTLDFATPKIS